MRFEFFGKASIIAGIAALVVVGFLIILNRLKVSPERVIKLWDEVKNSLPDSLFWNEFVFQITKQINNNPSLIHLKVKQTVQDAIDELNLPDSKVDDPTFTEEKEGKTSLGGWMRLRAPWLTNNKN